MSLVHPHMFNIFFFWGVGAGLCLNINIYFFVKTVFSRIEILPNRSEVLKFEFCLLMFCRSRAIILNFFFFKFKAISSSLFKNCWQIRWLRFSALYQRFGSFQCEDTEESQSWKSFLSVWGTKKPRIPLWSLKFIRLLRRQKKSQTQKCIIFF